MVVECSKPWEELGMRHKNSISRTEQQKPGFTMPARIVQCPKCRALLQEPPPGNPYYQCGNCSTTLQAKHATVDSSSASVVDERTRGSSSRSSTTTKSESSSGEMNERVVDDDGSTSAASWSPSRKDSLCCGSKGGRGVPERLPQRRRGGGVCETIVKQISSGAAAEMQSDQGGGYNNTSGSSSNIRDRRGGGGGPPVVQHSHDDKILSYMQLMRNEDLDSTQVALESSSGADYISRRGSKHQQEAAVPPGGGGRWSSPGGGGGGAAADSSFDGYSHQQRPPGRANHNGSDVAFRPQPGNSILKGGEFQRQQSSSQLTQQSSIYETKEVPDMTSTTITPPASASGRIMKLRWETRPESVEEHQISAGAEVMNRGGTGNEDRPHEDRQSMKETTSTERNWRVLGSRRQDRRNSDERNVQFHLSRTQSDGSEKSCDMYDNPAYTGDYEKSETSSTMDDVDTSEGVGGGRFSPPPDLRLPRDLRAGIAKSRPNLPRSNPPGTSGRSNSSVYSEESNPRTAQTPTELDTLDNNPPLQFENLTRDSRRQSSFDAAQLNGPRGGGFGSTSSANSSPGVPAPEPGSLRKSSSGDFMGMTAEHGQMHNRGSSDPGTSLQQANARPPPQQLPYQQQQQWVNRLVQQQTLSPSGSFSKSSPSARPPTHVPWSQNTSGSNLPSQVEAPNSSRPPYGNSFSVQQSNHPPTNEMLDSASALTQVPPKQGIYPSLPPPGSLPHVSCQYCRTLLAVPPNLPAPKKNLQKIRCGACNRILTFSVPQPLDSSISRSEVQQLGQSLFASSPDAQIDINPGYRARGRSMSSASDEPRRSGRRFSDLSDRSHTITRNDSLGSSEMPSDDELVERARLMKLDSFSTPSSDTASYSEGSPSRFGRSSPGPLYPKAAGSCRLQPEERTRFANHLGPGVKRLEDHVTSSDSESESLHHHLPSVRSPTMEGLHHHGHSNSPTRNLNSPPTHLNSPSSVHVTGEHKEAVHEQPKLLNIAMKGISKIRELTHKTRSKVNVNGIAIAEPVVKKAELQAGPIQPGHYWYDSQAGFWGVAGGPCLGIIPPFIEELNFPMPKDCACGKTGILVNGRELHNKDLEILVQRGLPTQPGRAYRIEIDGKVVDEQGTVIKSLGRLAPTLEERGRGGGMYPRA